MGLLRHVLATVLVLAGTAPLGAQNVPFTTGNDTYIAGAVVNETLDTAGDTFLAGRSVAAAGVSQGDLHAFGFDVSIDADTLDDLYVLGATVFVRSETAGDVTAMGYSVRTQPGAVTGGNARLFASSVTIEGPVSGALMAAGEDVYLNAAVEGDARITARSLSFGPDAVVRGTLTYSTAAQMQVPDRVAPADRVVFDQRTASDAWTEFDKVRKEMPVLPTFASMLAGFIISLLFFVALGGLMLGFMPKRLEKMRTGVAAAPGQTFLLGLIGLSILFGIVPIAALTIVGLPFVPIAILAIVVAWTLGYALGAYSVAMRIWDGFGGDETPGNATRMLLFVAAITFVALLNFIPFVGWVANYTLVLLGIGAMTRTLFNYMIGNPGIALDVDMTPIDD